MSVPRLWELTRALGDLYGTEDLAPFLYSLVRLQRPRTVLELGSGTGVTSLWMAQALVENGEGRIWSLDSGVDWPELLARLRKRPRAGLDAAVVELLDRPAPTHRDYLSALSGALGLDPTLTFEEGVVTFGQVVRREAEFEFLASPLDMVFVDVRHDPIAATAIVAFFLSRLTDFGSLLIDSLPTFWPSFLAIERLVDQLNAGKIPRSLLESNPALRVGELQEQLATRKLTLVHFVERKDRAQNSAAWIKIDAIDHLPRRGVAMRMGLDYLE